jgi:hypothetical protein
MDDSQFDELTKTLATSTSRRQALKTLGATVVGAVLGLSGIGTALAKCGKTGAKCSKNKPCCKGLKCCKGKCCGEMCCAGKCCGANKTCVSKKCVCLPPFETCNGRCVDTMTDRHNCGRCGIDCPSGSVCCGGICCLSGEACCNGRCTDTMMDLGHCGSCVNSCITKCNCGSDNCGIRCCSGVCVSVDPLLPCSRGIAC